MRTTLNLDDDLMRLVKQRAAAEGRTVTSLIEEGLRALLRQAEERVRTPIVLTTFGGDGVRPGVDINDSRRLNDLLDEDEYARYRAESRRQPDRRD